MFKITIKKKELLKSDFIGIIFKVANIKSLDNKTLFEIIDYISDENRFKIQYLNLSKEVVSFKNNADEIITKLSNNTYEMTYNPDKQNK